MKQRKWNTVVPVTAVLKTWIELFHLYRVTKLKTYDSNVFLNLLKAENGKRFYFLSLATSVSVIPKETSLTIPFDILAEKNFLIKICLMKGLNIEIVSTLHSYVNFHLYLDQTSVLSIVQIFENTLFPITSQSS